jgi:hypothetical protein
MADKNCGENALQEHTRAAAKFFECCIFLTQLARQLQIESDSCSSLIYLSLDLKYSQKYESIA